MVDLYRLGVRSYAFDIPSSSGLCLYQTVIAASYTDLELALLDFLVAAWRKRRTTMYRRILLIGRLSSGLYRTDKALHALVCRTRRFKVAPSLEINKQRSNHLSDDCIRVKLVA